MKDELIIDVVSKKKVFLTIFIGLMILVLIVIGSYYYFIGKIDPNDFLIKTSNYLTEKVDFTFKQLEKYQGKTFTLDDEIKVDGNIVFSTNIEEVKLFNNYKVDFTSISSLEKEEIQIDFDVLEDKTTILDGNFYLVSDEIYIKLNDLYDKLLKVETLDTNIFNELKNNYTNTITLKDINKVLTSYINYLQEALKESESSYQVKDLIYITYKYQITSDNQDKIINKYQELVNNDQELQVILNNLKKVGITLEMDITSLELATIEVEVNVLTRKIENLMIESEENTIKLKKDAKKDRYILTTNENNGYLTVTKDMIYLELYEKEELVSTLELKSNKEILSVSLFSITMDITLSLDFVSNTSYKVRGDINLKDEEEIKINLLGEVQNKENGYLMNMSLEATNNQQNIGLVYQGNTTYHKDSLTKINPKECKDINELNEVEVLKIENQFMENIKGTNLEKELMGDVENS